MVFVFQIYRYSYYYYFHARLSATALATLFRHAETRMLDIWACVYLCTFFQTKLFGLRYFFYYIIILKMNDKGCMYSFYLNVDSHNKRYD